jgi:hypothetical protein
VPERTGLDALQHAASEARRSLMLSSHQVAPALAYSSGPGSPDPADTPMTAISNSLLSGLSAATASASSATMSGGASSLPMIQPSHLAARRRAPALSPPIHTGTRGRCTGNGAMVSPSTW